MLQEAIGFKKPPRYESARTADVHDSLADVGPAENALGYKTLVDFQEGLRRTVEWYRGELSRAGNSVSALA